MQLIDLCSERAHILISKVFPIFTSVTFNIVSIILNIQNQMKEIWIVDEIWGRIAVENIKFV